MQLNEDSDKCRRLFNALSVCLGSGNSFLGNVVTPAGHAFHVSTFTDLSSELRCRPRDPLASGAGHARRNRLA
eukprot:3245926-Pyramimonas_sp.AAC.1